MKPHLTATFLDAILVICLLAVCQTFFADPFVQEHVRLDAVVCLCDSPRLLRTLVESSPPPPPPPPLSAGAPASLVASKTNAAATGVESSALAGEGSEQTSESNSTGPTAAAAASTLVISQLALSDRVLLNKSDLITAAEVCSIPARPPASAVFTRCLTNLSTTS